MKFYIISDTHFNHDNIIKFCGRPEDHEKKLFKGMSAIREEDCIIHLGDICIGNDLEVHEKFIKPLKCKKILVAGNHDSKSLSWYMEHGWDFACNEFRMSYGGKKLVFSHIPIAWDGLWELCIHGHLHNLARRNESGAPLVWFRLYAPEQRNYLPVELNNLIQE